MSKIVIIALLALTLTSCTPTAKQSNIPTFDTSGKWVKSQEFEFTPTRADIGVTDRVIHIKDTKTGKVTPQTIRIIVTESKTDPDKLSVEIFKIDPAGNRID